MSVIYLCIIYSTYAINKWSTIFKRYPLFLLFAAEPDVAVFETIIVPLTCIYASL